MDRLCRRMAHHPRRADGRVENRRGQRNNRCADRAGHNASRPETNSQNSARQKSAENLQSKSASYQPAVVSSETVEHFDFARHDPKEVEERGRVYRMSSSTSPTTFC